MTYRAVVRHVRYWRGAVHRWSTVYQFVGTAGSGLTSSDAQLVLNADNKMLYKTGPSLGGTYECALYNQASGGVPIAVYTAFDWTAPGSWLAGSATAWTTTAAAYDGNAECATSVSWPAGLSSSGKPVHLRKWYHSCPVPTVSGGANQIAAADVTALNLQAQTIIGVLAGKGLSLGSATGRIAGTATVTDPFFGNHQMDRGRRRKLSPSAAKAQADYSAVLAIINGQQDTGP